MATDNLVSGSKSSNLYDTIIIGAGMSGLTAALKMASEKKKVLLLEQHNLFGGLATSFIRGRFQFEAPIHEFYGLEAEDNMTEIRRFLEAARVYVDFYKIPEAYRVVLPRENINVEIPLGVQSMIDVIDREVPCSRAGLSSLMNLCKDVANSLKYISFKDGIEKISKKVMGSHVSFLKTAGYTAETVIRTFNIPQKALYLIYPYWFYIGIPVSNISFTVWAYLMADYFNEDGENSIYKKHPLGMDVKSTINSLGIQADYNTKVKQILLKDGKAVGLETSKGEKINANSVVYGSCVNKLYSGTSLGNGRKLINNKQEFYVHLVLDLPPENLNIQNYSYFIGYTEESGSGPYTYQTLYPINYITAICLNKIVPNCASVGTTEISISTMSNKRMEDSDIQAEAYSDYKKRIAQSMIQRFGDVLGVDLFKHIKEMHISSPLSISGYSGLGSNFAYSL
ncbi:MAG: NAD(P)-binding protein [Bacillota bacterium]|nr:NAD(P)-binding protein [Bacillota bacterium]